MKTKAVLFCIVNLVACSTATPIMKADESPSGFQGAVYEGELYRVNDDIPGETKYRVFHQGASSFVSVESVKESAEREIEAFCTGKGLAPAVLTVRTSKPPHVLGNFPRIELVFSCIAAPATSPAGAGLDARYERLRKLKELLDSGAITQAEFEAEKKVVLSQ